MYCLGGFKEMPKVLYGFGVLEVEAHRKVSPCKLLQRKKETISRPIWDSTISK